MGFQKVERKKAKLRMALTGVSGAGKTLGSLYIAFGITGSWDKIAFIDTEHERARFYADRSDLGTGGFLYEALSPPYSPERYINLVKEAEGIVGNNGIIIIDSLSHAWNNEGGILETKDKIASIPGKNSYTAWNEAGKIQSKFINDKLSVDCHVIVTMRSKMEYALQLNDKGKQQPVKVGLAPIQREDTEYEFDIVLDIGRNHIANTSKDVTFLDTYGEVITPELGEKLRNWLENGKAPERCDNCGKIIKPYKGRSVADIIAGSMEKYGHKYCAGCCLARKRMEQEAAQQQQEQEQAEIIDQEITKQE